MIATLSAGLAHVERRADAPASPAPAHIDRQAPVEDRLRAIQRELRSYCLPVDPPASSVVRLPTERES